jgi:hypothetical protein
MRLPSAVERRPWLLAAAAIVVQWLSTLAAALWSHGNASLGDPHVLANVAVFGPVALAAAYAIAVWLAGPAGAAWTLAVWLASPWLLVGIALRNYDETAQDALLPLLVGLAPQKEFAAGALALVGVALLTSSHPAAVAVAGVAFGTAGLLVPATLAFPFAALFALLVLWRPRDAGLLAAGLVPFLAAVAISGGLEADERSFDALVGSLDGFREYFWSKRVLEWLPFAGALGLARRSLVTGLAAGGGFVAFAIAQGSRVDNTFEGASIFVRLLPGLPAYALLAAALPLLVPTLAPRLPAPVRA